MADDSSSCSSDSFYELFCQPCSVNKRHLEAHGFCEDCQEYLCRDCYRTHRKPRPTRNHILLDKDDMPTTPDISSPIGRGRAEEVTKRCKQHPNEVIKYYCSKHDVIVCYFCATGLHFFCADYIPDIANGIGISHQYKETHEAIAETVKQVEKVIKQAWTNLSNVKRYYDSALNDVQQMRKEVNDLMDTLVNKMKAEADVFRSTDTAVLSAIIENCHAVLADINSLKRQLKNKCDAKQECNLFIEMKTSEEKLREFQSQIKTYELNNLVTYYTLDRSDALRSMRKEETIALRRLLQKHQFRPQAGCTTIGIGRYGISVVGGAKSTGPGERIPITVETTKSSRAVSKDGRLKIGDQIISVNGVSLDGLSRYEANKLLCATKSMTLTILSKDRKK